MVHLLNFAPLSSKPHNDGLLTHSRVLTGFDVEQLC